MVNLRVNAYDKVMGAQTSVFLAEALVCVKEADEIILKAFGKSMAFTQKTDASDLLTVTDGEVQRVIHARLKTSFPDHGFLGEEAAGTDVDTAYRWVVDPVDGTANFIQGIEMMGTSIALQENGASVVGVISMPALGALYHAEKGSGAFCNGERIGVCDCSSLRDAYVAEIFSDRTHRGMVVKYPHCRAYRRFGSAIASCAYLACGRIHALALQCHEWDIAAAEVIIAEAGGRCRTWRPSDDSAAPLSFVAAVPGIFDEFEALVLSEYYTDLS